MEDLDLRLSHEEHEVLVTALESYLSDLRLEISSTDDWRVREDLKHQKGVIRKILETLRESVEAAV